MSQSKKPKPDKLDKVMSKIGDGLAKNDAQLAKAGRSNSRNWQQRLKNPETRKM